MIYNYEKTPVSSDRLSEEIRSSVITVALDYITSNGDDLSIHFKANLSTEEVNTLDQIVTSHDGTPLPDNEIKTVKLDESRTSLGLHKVAVYEPEGDAATIVSHNFTDKCSWYHGSAQATAEELELLSGNTFKSDHTHWIDLTHGRAYDEDNVVATTPSYIPSIFIDGVIQTTGFAINYELGEVTFTAPVNGVVTATYKYADKSWFIVKPKTGKILSIRTAEVQFTSDIVISSPFVFEAWVNHPQYGMIPVPGSRISYKNAKDFISACNEGQGLIPKWGELTHDVHVFPFHYARPKSLKYSQAVEIRVYCLDHNSVAGEFATATFYVNVESEL